MMNGQEKSDSAIVAVKSPNKAGSPAAEAMEPRAGTKGNADQQSTHRARDRARVSHAPPAYGKPQGKGRKNGSPRFSTTSMSTHFGRPSMRSGARRLRGWMA